MREMQADVVGANVILIQARLRAHRAATQLLVDHYTQRVQWYDDSRTATMMSPLAKHVSNKRCVGPSAGRSDGPDSGSVGDGI